MRALRRAAVHDAGHVAATRQDEMKIVRGSIRTGKVARQTAAKQTRCNTTTRKNTGEAARWTSWGGQTCIRRKVEVG